MKIKSTKNSAIRGGQLRDVQKPVPSKYHRWHGGEGCSWVALRNMASTSCAPLTAALAGKSQMVCQLKEQISQTTRGLSELDLQQEWWGYLGETWGRGCFTTSLYVLSMSPIFFLIFKCKKKSFKTVKVDKDKRHPYQNHKSNEILSKTIQMDHQQVLSGPQLENHCSSEFKCSDRTFHSRDI